MTGETSCEKLREIGAELALGVLPGRERAGAVAHLERCADCREYIAQLTLLGDRLIGLLPASEPPVGFESRVAQALTQRAAHEKRPRSRASGIPRPGVLGRLRPRVAAAAGTLLLVVGFGGWAVGTAIESTMSRPAATAAGTGMLWGGLTSADAVGRPAGEVYAHPGSPGWIYMNVDLTRAGGPHEGKVTCRLVRKDGTTVRVGDLTLHRGRGSWGGPATVDPAKLAGARVLASDGTVLARTHFATGEETS
ncbi:hypothetical protein ACIP4X_11355 [Streptomyces sp. NPDC088817]|uniref:hypothetical protein n=1 Tax=unclassified Streptomyces TaxID=2593676 RepID=UPI0036F0682E